MPGRRIKRTTATSTTARTSTVMTTASPDLTGEKSVSAAAAGQRSSQDGEMPRAAGELRLSECQVKQLVIKSLKCRFL